ncbi:MAG: TetR/AcrR family transcriptional regulator [Thermodesulfobacteriota bacterium]
MKITTHQTQEEKSRVMRLRLMEATLACLQERGYHGTSLTQILKRAGVSRGAWRHHYNSKKELVAASAEHFLKGPVNSARDLMIKRKNEKAGLSYLVDYIWDNFYQGPYRDIWLEFHVACRTDRELRQRLVPVIQRFFRTLDDLWREHFQTTKATDADVDILLNLTLYVLRGMAIQSIIIEDVKYYQGLRTQWLNMIAPLIAIRHGG